MKFIFYIQVQFNLYIYDIKRNLLMYRKFDIQNADNNQTIIQKMVLKI